MEELKRSSNNKKYYSVLNYPLRTFKIGRIGRSGVTEFNYYSNTCTSVDFFHQIRNTLRIYKYIMSISCLNL